PPDYALAPPEVIALTPATPERFTHPEAIPSAEVAPLEGEAVPPVEETIGVIFVALPPTPVPAAYRLEPAVDALAPAGPETFAEFEEIEAIPPVERLGFVDAVPLAPFAVDDLLAPRPVFPPAPAGPYGAPPAVNALALAGPEILPGEAFPPMDDCTHLVMPAALPVSCAPSYVSDEPYHPDPAVLALAPAEPETFIAEVEEGEAIPPAEDRFDVGVTPLPPAETPAPALAFPPISLEPYEEPPPVFALIPDRPEVFEPEPAVEMEPLPEPDFFDLFDEEEAEPGAVEPPEDAAGAEVTEEDVRALLAQIAVIQEDIVRDAGGARDDIDIHQHALHYATQLLRAQTASAYDEARMIVYRVRADREHEAGVREWTRRYSRRLLLYLSLLTVIVVILGMLEPAARGAAARLGLSPAVAGLYMPMLFGALGAIFGAFWVLIEQLFIRRDFDPVYVAWYFLTPVIGLISGILVYAVAYAAFAGAAIYPVWALCFAAGAASLLIWRRRNPTA
ncbi:MAG: hypothetical protein JXB47_06125, partial [Anaerolineae bacterium]|nr:hypothetical protein [Anaerolineae bacterium]